LSGCLFVSQINVKTAEPIGPKIFCGTSRDPRKVYGWLYYQKIPVTKFYFWKFRKSTKFCYKIRETFVLFLFYNEYKENMFTIEIEDGREAPEKPSYLYLSTIYIYFACLLVSNKRKNSWTDWANILCGTSHDPREGL